MQINAISNTNFGAKINPSETLNLALDAAKDMAGGTETERQCAANFYNSLRTLENDVFTNNFMVVATREHLYPYMKLDGNRRFLEHFNLSDPKELGKSFVKGITNFVEGHYFKFDIANEAKDVDLTKAFDTWRA